MLPWLIAAMAVSVSAFPVNMMRTVSGAVLFTRRSNSIPSIPGIRMSEITTAYGPLV